MLQSYARQLRLNASKAERALWQCLRCKQMNGCKFRRQHVIGRFIVDFVCLPKKLIIEVDGGQHATQSGYDVYRTQFLKLQGFRVLRFWNNEVLGNMEGVLKVIEDNLEGKFI